MLYRKYGQTGRDVSLLSFGGMRFADVDDHDRCVAMMVAAAEGGVNYFDTAPGYFETRSETVFGKGFAELRRRNLPFMSATKTFKSERDDIHRELEAQLRRLDLPAVDFYHIWCITELAAWDARKKNDILKTFARLKEEGLIRHVVVSSHLIGDEIKELLMEGVFEGVLFGYSAYNFRSREPALDAIREKRLGAVVMNPFGGGLVPQNGDRFAFLRRPGESVSAAALRFIWDHQDITTALVGFDTIEHVRDALDAMDGYVPRTAEELTALKASAPESLEGICTGCGYCDDCPQGIPVPRFMDAYNQKILGGNAEAIATRLKWHWGGLDKTVAGRCVDCGKCEADCTQHLEIVKRLREISA